MTFKLTLVFLAIFLLCQCCTVPESYTLTSNHSKLVFEPEVGGRIASLTYHGTELLNTEIDSAHIMWGSTLWTSPQKDWDWPPPAWLDLDPYQVTNYKSEEITMKSAPSPESHLTCTKHIQVAGQDSFMITYTIENNGRDIVQLGLWENSRIPYRGRATWQTQKELWELGPEFKPVAGNSTWIFERSKTPRKLFKKSEGGFLKYHHENIVWRKEFDIIPKEDIAPNHAAIELYYDPIRNFAELEVNGRYETIPPGDQITMQVLWSLYEEAPRF